jgi:hypothetical protein
MNSRLLNAGSSSDAPFRPESVRWVPAKENVKNFVIALLLLIASSLTFVATMLVRYPQKVDAFLNSDQPVESKQVVTGSK